jgi:heptosyltransferase II
MRILCICPIGIGNYLLCYPAFSELKRLVPRASLHMLALRSGIASIAGNDALWEKVHVFDPTQLPGNLPSIARSLADLRKQKFDACLNYFPSNTWQYHLLPRLLGIPLRYGFKYGFAPLSKLWFFCNKTIPVDGELHDVRQNLALTAFFTGNEKADPSEVVFPKLFGENDLQWAKDYLALISRAACFIGIHPGSSREHGMAAKRWSADSMAGLTDKACSALNAEALILGGPDEREVKIKCAASMKQRAHIVEAITLARTSALMSLCRMCICNDSGLMHISACQGTPTVGIFGPTDEKRNGPIGGKTLVIRKIIPGFPVWTALNVGDRRSKGVDPGFSLRELSVDDAWGKLRPWIDVL